MDVFARLDLEKERSSIIDQIFNKKKVHLRNKKRFLFRLFLKNKNR